MGTKSRYEEDIFPGNHTSVWGSYWDAGRWGYKCCHSFIKQSYCTGDAGKVAFASTSSVVNSVEPKESSEASQESSSGMAKNSQKTPKLDKNDENEAESSASSSSS